MLQSTFTRKKKKSVRIADDQPTKNENKKEEQTSQERSLPGTRISVLTGQPNISTGHSFIDSAWGGGLGIGQIALIQEDVNSTYYKVLLSLSIAQALSIPEPQECLVISHSSFLPLPKPLHQKNSSYLDNVEGPKQGKMKIAWRYDDNIKEKTDPSGTRRAPFSNVFDLHKEMDLTESRKDSLTCINLTDLRSQFPSEINGDLSSPSSNNFFNHLLDTIKTKVNQCKE